MSDLIRLPDDFRNDKDRESAHEPVGALIVAPRRSRIVASLGGVALLLSLGWGAGAAIDRLHAPAGEQQAAQQAAKAATEAAAKALSAEEAQKQEIGSLRAHVEQLKAKLEAQSQQAHASEGGLVALRKAIADQKTEAAATAEQLQAKIDRLQAQAAQLQAQAQANKTLEKHADKPLDRTPVATIAKAEFNKAELNPEARPLPKPLTPYRAFVLRDVSRGVAVVESQAGLEEVGPGDVLPGGARVDRLEKRGAQWVVVTDRGYIAGDRRWED